MSDTQTPPARAARGPRGHLGALIGIALLVLAVVLLAGRQPPTHAATGKVDIAYVSVTDVGPTARAWYDGAPSPGVPVQTALDRFAKQGYQVVAVTQDQRLVTTAAADLRSESFVILLQRVN